MRTGPYILSVLLFFLTVSCRHSRPADPPRPSLMEVSKQELATAIEERDRLMELVRLISEDMEKIRRLEAGIPSETGSIDSIQAGRVIADINVVKRTLRQRRLQLNELEETLQQSVMYNDELQGAINALRRQLERQSGEINSLRSQLLAANRHIGSLIDTVDSLSNTVTTVTNELDEAERTAAVLETELNTCYYIVADKSRLKDYKILETGFLRRARLMEGDYDIDMFTMADKRMLDTLSLGSRKARVLTKHPVDSYGIIDADGMKSLVIVNPERFWSLTDYLVIQSD